jgi:phosphoribosylanthranilate isomerase
MNTPKVKVCCIMSRLEAEMAIDAGAWALGLVAEMPSGVGPISDEEIAEIVPVVPAGIETFLLTSRVEADGIIDHHRVCNTSTIQLVDHVRHKDLVKIRSALPEVKLVQVIHVIDRESVVEARLVAPLVDMILLDSGNPTATKRELGGTGRIHNWDLSLEICKSIGIPMFLAGGLKPDNVAGAIRHVRPFGVDLCSGIRKNGKLDSEKLGAFFSSVGTAREDSNSHNHSTTWSPSRQDGGHECPPYGSGKPLPG